MTLPPTLLLTHEDVARFLPMGECIEVMRGALRDLADGSVQLPLRTVVRIDGATNAFATMPAVINGESPAIGAKIITVFPGNDATPYDSHIGVVLLFDAVHGALEAIADASSITAIRTSAISGLATDLLAREDARELGVLGAGVLCLPHIEAVRSVRAISRVKLWTRSGTRAEAAADAARAKWPDLEIVVVDSAEAAVREADVVCTITSSRTPVLLGEWLRPGTHVNAVGASMRDARELDTAAVAKSKLFADRRESLVNEAGDYLIPLGEGAIGPSHVRGELGEIITGRIAGRTTREDVTLFKSLGLAVEDVASLQHLVRRAREAGAGATVHFGGLRAH